MLFQNFKTKLINKFDNHCERTCHFNAFINSSEVNRDVLNQHYEIDSSLISNLYQPQTSISNTYVLTFSDEVLKAITNYVENNQSVI